MYRVTDVFCFAGGFTLGAVQAGFELVAKREGPGGFGAPAAESNRHLLGDGWKLEACDPKDWTPVSTDFLVANPPCSGWSVRSVHVPPKGIDRKSVDTLTWTNSFRGRNSKVNQCMWDLVEYAGKCKDLKIVVFESVQQAGKQGLDLMRDLRVKLESDTDEKWDLHHVFHNCLSVGGNTDRRRYFWVASRVPFGVLPPCPKRPVPRSEDVLRGVGPGIDGNETPDTMEARRIASLLSREVELGSRETISEAAGRFVSRYGSGALRQLDAWDSSRTTYFEKRGWRKDQYQPRRWDADAPCPVITGKIQESIHPTEPRCITMREAARVLGYPESWKLSAYETDAWIGKGIPVQSGRWISESARRCLDGDLEGLERGEPLGDREWVHNNTTAFKADV